MNELDTLRKLRATPSPGNLSSARADLLAATRTANRRPSQPRWRMPRLAFRFAVACALAIGLLVGATVIRQDAARQHAMSPALFLEQAAAAVEKSAVDQQDRPRDGQWVYQKFQDGPNLCWAGQGENGYQDCPPDVSGTYEVWFRFDGQGYKVAGEDGRLYAKAGIKDVRLNPSHIWSLWESLPRDPKELLAALERELDLAFTSAGATTPADPEMRRYWLIDLFTTLLTDQGVAPPNDLRAALYRALALVPDLELIEGVTDLEGRAAVVFTVPSSYVYLPTGEPLVGGVVLDAKTYAYLGWASMVDDGKVTHGSAFLEAAVVDKPGER